MRKLRMYDHVITPEGPGYVTGAGMLERRGTIKLVPMKKTNAPRVLIAVRFPQRRYDYDWFWREEIEHDPHR